MLSTRLASLILAQAQGQGFLPSQIPGVVLMRMDRHLPRAPTVYDPCIVIVAQGRKVGSFNGRRYVYDARHCLTLTVPLPFESETFGSAERPFLGLAVAVTPALVTDLLMRMDGAPAEPPAGDVISSVPLNVELLSVAVRLLESLRDTERARVLGPNIVRELVYLLLSGPGGGGLRSLAVADGRLNRIAKVLQRLQTEFALDHDMATLARDAGMSPSTFHARFKAVTGESPLQYLKLIRLHQARTLMVNAGLSIQVTAARVGYESVSQFSREFKRLFGDSPGTAAVRLRAALNEAHQSQLRATLSFGERDR
ncbi:MAG TPA: AraC family transcriptional regulator [Duganella sp.]|nr:AraC family transcriptional regulator [Duganella sp.]